MRAIAITCYYEIVVTGNYNYISQFHNFTGADVLRQLEKMRAKLQSEKDRVQTDIGWVSQLLVIKEL